MRNNSILKRTATATLAAALSVPMALAASPAAAATDSFDDAKAGLLSAAYQTQRVAQGGFHLVMVSSLPDSPGFNTRLDAWANLYGEAAVRSKSSRAVVSTVDAHQGAYFDFDKGGLRAWGLVDQDLGKFEERVLKRLPSGVKTRYSVGPVPSDWSTRSGDYGYTANQVFRSLDALGHMPWNAADIVSLCGQDGPDYAMTCTGEETVDDTGTAWTFAIEQYLKYPGFEPILINIEMLVRADGAGLITSAQYRTEENSSVLVTTSTAEYSLRMVVPTPKLRASETVESRALVSAAAKAGAKSVAEKYVRSVDKYLKERDLPLTPKTARKAGAKLLPEALTWPGMRWTQSVGYVDMRHAYALEVEASDGITDVGWSVTPRVEDGKWVIGAGEESGRRS